MMKRLATGNIGTGNTSILATFNERFGFTEMEIGRIEKAAFGADV